MIFATPELRAEEKGALEKIQALRRDLNAFVVARPTRWMGTVRRVLTARAIQGSNSIEGIEVSDEDAVAAVEGAEPSDAQSEDWKAVSGCRRAMTYVLALAEDQHFKYTTSILNSLHFMMTEYDPGNSSPGLWRKRPVYVHNEASNEIVYEGPEADSVPALMDELIGALEGDADAPPTVRAAMAHLNLVMIHPYRDGNGRMARCLQTLVLAREGLLAPEFSSIEEYLGRNTLSYYEILAEVGQGRWSPENDARAWVRYCLTAHYVQAQSVLRRVRESEEIWQSLEELASQNKLAARTIVGLFHATIGLRLRNSSYRAALLAVESQEISNQVATSDLKALVDAGLLNQRGAKRGTYYEAANPILEVRRKVQSARKPLSAEGLLTP